MKNRINHRRLRRLALLLAFMLLVGCTLIPTALMQTDRQTNPPPLRPVPVRPDPIRIPTRPIPIRPIPDGQRRDAPPARGREVVKLDPSVTRAVTRPAIPFKPLEMVDPRTGSAVTPDTMLTLENRRQITAAKFYEQMNKLEAGLNKSGYSFRDQQKEVVTNEVMVDKEKTLAQIRSMRFATPNPRIARQLSAIAQAHRDYIRTVNPYYGKLAPRRFSPRVTPGLYQQKVDVLVPQLITIAKPASSIKFTVLERPDIVPGDGPVQGLGKEVQTLPEIVGDPGWAETGKRTTSIQVNASWSMIAFYVNYNYYAPNTPVGSTGPLAPRYVWQVAKAGPNLDNLGSFAKAWATEFDKNEMANWTNPPGLIASGDVNFANPLIDIKDPARHLFQIDFGKLVGDPPVEPVNYVVRIIPVNADGSIAGYPSRPILVTYGTHPEFKPPQIKLHPDSAKIPANNVAQDVPASFGNPKVMSVNFHTWMKSNGSPGHQSASLGFDAGCSVYGHQFSLLGVSAYGEVSPLKYDYNIEEVTYQGQAEGGVKILLAGVEVPCDTCKHTVPTALSFQYDKSQPINESFTLDFPIGPIDVSATIGIRGEVGVGGSVSLYPSNVNSPFSISAGPHLSVNAFLEAGVGIGLDGFDVVEVGVEGNVNLISAGFVVGFNINNFQGSYGNYFGQVSDLKVLNGTFDGFAEAGIWPIKKKWTHTLYSWGGYDLLATDPSHATLFEGSF